MKAFYRYRFFLVAILILAILVAGYFLLTDKSSNQSEQNGKSVDIAKYQNFADVKQNITYSKNLKLDIYYPKKALPAGGYPVVVYVHGGGWYDGDKTIVDQLGSVEHLIKTGFAVASVNYRLAPAVMFPAPVEDVKSAIGYLNQNAGSLNINAQEMGLMGSSSGANLGAMAVLTSTNQNILVLRSPNRRSHPAKDHEHRNRI